MQLLTKDLEYALPLRGTGPSDVSSLVVLAVRYFTGAESDLNKH